MNLILLAVPLLAATPLLQQFRDSDVDTLKFHRVHLTNGNFIDGQIVKETATSVLLQLRAGEMTIRRDMINRVEFVKMRDRREAPIPVKGDKPNPPDGGAKGDKEKEPSRETVTTETPEAIKKKVDLILFKFKNSPGGGDRDIPFQEIAALGEDAAVYLASRVPAFDLKTQDAMAVALINLNNLKRSARVDNLLEGYLVHEAPAVRAVSVNVLSTGASELEKWRMFRPMVKDKDRSVRLTVLSCIATVEDQQWFDNLSDISADADADIRSRALRVLRNLAERHNLKEKLGQQMVNNLRSPDVGVQVDSLHTISLLGQKEFWKDVTPMLRAQDALVRAAAAQVLSNLGSAEAGEDLVAAASAERETSVRGPIAAAIQKFRTIKAVEPMIQWLRESNEDVQKIAEVTLRTLTGENLGNDADKWQAWWDKNKPN